MENILYKIWKSTLTPGNMKNNEAHSLFVYEADVKNKESAAVIFDDCMRKDIQVITKGSRDYPIMLSHINDPPDVLYVKGNIRQEQKVIGVVGSRKPSPYGLKCANFFVRGLIKSGYAIISGMALGIDQRAHEASIKGQGITYAVLGSGFDHIYPKSNIALSEEIIQKGALISEYPPDTKPQKWHFPQRNRIISGFSDALLVVEGKLNSGSLITAMHSIEQGREVFCIPGNIFSENSRGVNALINDGAVLVNSPSDIIEHMANIVY